jgi:hypothetical protein
MPRARSAPRRSRLETGIARVTQKRAASSLAHQIEPENATKKRTREIRKIVLHGWG